MDVLFCFLVFGCRYQSSQLPGNTVC